MHPLATVEVPPGGTGTPGWETQTQKGPVRKANKQTNIRQTNIQNNSH